MKKLILCLMILSSCEQALPPQAKNKLNEVPDKDSVFIDERILNEIVNYYKRNYIEGAKMETENTDSLLTLTFWNIPTKDNAYDGFNISIYISKLKDSYLFGDINNDQKMDLIADIGTEGGGSGGNVWWNELAIFMGENGNFKLKSVIQSQNICGCNFGNFHPEKIQDGLIVGHSICWADTDGHCCPSLEYLTAVKYDSSKLVFLQNKLVQ